MARWQGGRLAQQVPSVARQAARKVRSPLVVWWMGWMAGAPLWWWARECARCLWDAGVVNWQGEPRRHVPLRVWRVGPVGVRGFAVAKLVRTASLWASANLPALRSAPPLAGGCTVGGNATIRAKTSSCRLGAGSDPPHWQYEPVWSQHTSRYRSVCSGQSSAAGDRAMIAGPRPSLRRSMSPRLQIERCEVHLADATRSISAPTPAATTAASHTPGFTASPAHFL